MEFRKLCGIIVDMIFKKKYEEKKMLLKLIVYINNFFCFMCVKVLENCLNKNKNVKFIFYVINMYYIK